MQELQAVKPEKIEVIFDEFGDLDRQVQQFKPVADRHEELKKRIRQWFEDQGYAADASAIAHGKRYEIHASERKHERELISKLKAWLILRRGLSVGKCLELWSITLKNLEKNIAATQLAPLLRNERTGHRTITAVPKAPPPKAA